MNTKNKAILKFSLFVVILILAIIIFWKPLTNIFSDKENVKEFVLGFGIFAPIIFILVIALQVLLAPIPGQVAGLAGGFIFGAALGTIYSMMGLIIGSFFAFYLSRKFGRPFVEKVVDKKTINKFDKTINEKGLFALFLIYLLPALPDDAISFLAGLTKIKIRTLVLISAIGRLPGFIILSIIGAGLASENTGFSILLFITMMLISILIYLKKDYFEKLMIKLIKTNKGVSNSS